MPKMILRSLKWKEQKASSNKSQKSKNQQIQEL